MKQILEFDTSMQPAETTYNELAVTINAYKIAQGINSLQIHRVAAKISKALREAFLTWGDDDMTAAQMTALTAILQSQYGLVGYTSPIPMPILMVGGANPSAGLAVAATLTAGGTTNGVFVSVGEYRGGGSYGASGQVTNVGAGNVYAFIQALVTGDHPVALHIENWSNATFTFPLFATAFTVKDTTPTTTNLKLANNQVIPAAVPWGAGKLAAITDWYVAQNGNLYLADRYGAYYFTPQGNLFVPTFDEAVVLGAL